MHNIAAHRYWPLIEETAIRIHAEEPGRGHSPVEYLPEADIHDFLVLNPSPELIREPMTQE